MKTFYKKMNFLKLLKLPALIFFMLALSYNVKAQGDWQPQYTVCYGTPITLFECPMASPNYCDSSASPNFSTKFHIAWYYFDNFGVQRDMFSGSVGMIYHLVNAGPFHGGSNWLTVVIGPGDAGYDFIAGNNLRYLQSSQQWDEYGLDGEAFNPNVEGPIKPLGTVSNVLCKGSNSGTITINSITGGSGTFVNFNWSSGQITENIANLFAGTYTLTVTDDRGCTGSNSFTITQPLTGGVIVQTTVTNVKCKGNQTGAISTAVSGGGGGPYSYFWSTSAITPNIVNLGAGIYTVTVSDQNGCNTVAVATVTQPACLPTFQATITNVACNGQCTGAITVTASCGTSPYTYLWYPGGMTIKDLTGLCAQNYTLTVTDFNGCPIQGNNSVTQPDARLTVIPSVTNVTCNGGDGCLTLAVSGGTPPYIFNWNPAHAGQDWCPLKAGTYTVTVTDNHGCTTLGVGTITQPTGMSLTLTVTNVKCKGNQTGAIATSVTGGAHLTDYAYHWSTSATTSNIAGLGAGIYTVTVTDNNGCTITGIGTVTQPACLPTFQATITNVACYGQCTGAITVTASCGTSPYTYLWYPGGMTIKDLTGLCAQNYTLTVTDFNGCPIQGNNSVTQPDAALTVIPSLTNVLCHGGDGCLTLSVSGGTPPYIFNWNPAHAGQDWCPLKAGTYTVTVTDNHGCTTLGVGTITEPTALSLTLTVTNVKCKGNQTGAIATSVTGGAHLTGYAYHWSTSATTSNIAGLGAGIYTVTVTDNNGCTITGIGTVTQPACLPTFQATITNVACYGQCTGAITVTASCGTSPYTYLWYPGGMTIKDLTGLCAQNYTLTVTDFNGCPIQGNNSVTQPDAALTVIPSVTNVLCYGGDGCLTLAVSGGTPPYIFNWNPAHAGQDWCPVKAGTYTVTVTDNHGCTTLGVGTITQPTALSLTLTVTNVKCKGNQTGAIATSVTGGAHLTDYAYHWSTSSTTSNIAGIGAGIYTVTVTDNNGCTITGVGTVTQPACLPTFQATITNVACYGQCTGAITVTASCGTSPYTYLWAPGGSTSKDRVGLCAQNYTLTVTDFNGCPIQGNNSVTQPDAALTVIPSVTNVLCYGGDGCLTLSVSGGTPPYIFNWNPAHAEQDWCPVKAGTYTVTVTDNHGCTTLGVGTITQPTALSLTLTVTNVKCKGNQTGAIATSVTGGAHLTGYAYHWSTSATTSNIAGLGSGIYTVTVTDNNGCTITGVGTVTQPACLPTFQATITNVACYGQCTGSITVTASCGTSPYTYLWYPGGMTIKDLTGLCAQNYTLTVTDFNGCPIQGNNSVTQPDAPLTVIPSVTNVLCFGGDGCLTLAVSGGTPPYIFNWNPAHAGQDWCPVKAGTYTVTVTDNHGCTTLGVGTITQPTALSLTLTVTNVKCKGNQTGAIATSVTGGAHLTGYAYHWSTSATTSNIAGLGSGIYTVTVTDNNGCTITGVGTVTQPACLPTFQATITNVACYGQCTGSITVTPSCGTSPYTYLWYPGGMTIKDLTGLCAQNYTLTVTDFNGCPIQGNNSVTQPDAPLTVIPSVTNVLCFGGDGCLTLAVSGGTPPYIFNWNPAHAGQDWCPVKAGTYTVTVTDNHGCTTLGVGTITQPTALSLTLAVTNVKCKGNQTGAIATTVTGGAHLTGYAYHWSTSATTSSIASLGSGIYTVTVTDNNGCTITGVGTITQPACLPTFQATITNVACYGQCTGAITVTPSCGTSPYTYLWYPGGMTIKDLTGLCAQNYTLTVTDFNGCPIQGNNSITQPGAPLDVQLTVTNIRCWNSVTGAITTSVTGGTPAYTYHWSNSNTTANLIGISAGQYCVTVTDAHGCTAVNCASVTAPDEWHPCFVCPPDQCQGDTVRYCICPGYRDATGKWIASGMRNGFMSSFEWTITGGTLLYGCCDTCVTVIWNHSNTGIICVTEIRHDPPFDGCRSTKCCTINLNPVPTPLITGSLTVLANSTTKYYTTYSSCYLYSWSVVGGVVVSGQGTDTIYVHWTDCSNCDMGHVKVCVTDACLPTMCCGCSMIDITITPSPTANLQGYVTYANPYGTPLNGVVIQLINSMGIVVGTSTSGPNFSNGSGAPGYYSFSDVLPDVYTMHITFNGLFGGINATDALLIELHAAHIQFLTGLPLKAGDVTADMAVNATDALWVKLRTVGMINYFPAGDWVFDNGIITIPSSGITTQPIGALCFGDVNASYIPQGMKEGSSLNVIDDGIMSIPVNESFNYTVKSSKSAELGAITLFFGYDQNRFEVQNVSTSVDGLRYNVDNSRVAVAWSNTKPLTLNSNDPILTLQLKAKETVSQPSQIFTVNSGSEVADATALVLNNFDLKMSSVVTLNNGKEFSIYNYPNPFQNSTEIVYTLPEQGHVKLVVTNMFGTVLSTLVDAEQSAGSYQVKVDPTVVNLSPGVYLYKIIVDGVTTSYNKTSKMLFTR